MERPSRRISPSSGTSSPARSRRVVVLPHPEGPRSEKNSPRPISSDTPSTAVCAPKRLVTDRKVTKGGVGIGAIYRRKGASCFVLRWCFVHCHRHPDRTDEARSTKHL